MPDESPPPPDRMLCPKCGSSDVRRSKGEGLVAILARAFSRWPFRCRSCRSKFYRHSDPPDEQFHEH